MERPIINDSGINRQMTETEHEQWLELVAEIKLRAMAREAAIAAKMSARAKLVALGLTENEIAALVG